MEKSLCGVVGFCIASVGGFDSQELGLLMLDWLALVVSFIALGFSIKAYLDSRWIEFEWNLDEDDDGGK